MFYFMPIWLVPTQQVNAHSPYNLDNNTSLDRQNPREEKVRNKYISQEQWQQYLKIFQEELKIMVQKQKKKLWTKEYDDRLLKFKEQQMDWKKIAQNIDGTNSQVCRRRYFRICQANMRWPKQIDEQIKYLYEVKNFKWSAIVDALSTKFNTFKKYSGKMIKERYEFYLRQGIVNRQWTVEQDVKLLKSVQKNGTLWKKILQSFQGRTQLQLKNRFNGTLKLIEKRVFLKLQNKSKKSHQSSPKNENNFCIQNVDI